MRATSVRIRLRVLFWGVLPVVSCSGGPCARPAQPPPTIARLQPEPAGPSHVLPEKLVFHPVRLDATDRLLPAQDLGAPFAHVAGLGFAAFTAIPDAPNGKKPYFSASMFKPPGFVPGGWLHNPTGLSAMLVRSGVRWFAFSGDRTPLEHARALVDHVLLHGLTEATDAWAQVPYASANPGELEYRGGDEVKHCDAHDACGRGDGPGNLEPDKIGELGHALVLLHRYSGEARYLEAAVRFADQLAAKVTPGDAKHAPWPFRVDAKTNTKVREPYTSNQIFTIALFDELAALGKAKGAHRAARDTAWKWLRQYPLETQHWQGFFEDIPIYLEPGTNPNQYSAGETARYLLDHPELDPKSLDLARRALAFIDKTFTVDVDAPNVGKTPGHWYGAEVISEQGADMAKMGSHTARYGSLLARLYERTSEAELRGRAFRSLAWATYCIDAAGVVKVGPDDREGYWFSDGYGDYLVHFLDAMAAVPAWAPSGEPHVLRSDDVLVEVAYGADGVRYRGSTGRGIEELRVPKKPVSIQVGGVEARDAAEVQAMAGGGFWLRVRRNGAEVALHW